MTTPTPADLAKATRDDILPLFDALRNERISVQDIQALEDWLTRWDALSRAVREASLNAENAYAADVRSERAQEAIARFSGQIDPFVEEVQVELGRKLLAAGYEPPHLATAMRNIRAQERLFSAENIPLKQRLQDTISRYNRIAGSITVEWSGETIPATRLTRYLTDPDRAVRERAWRAQQNAYADVADAIEDIVDEQVDLRRQIAANAGFDNYRDYAFLDRLRFDYTPQECETFHDAVRTEWLPLVADLADRQRDALGVETLRPWDIGVTSDTGPTRPAYATVAELHDGVERILRHVAPAFGDMYRSMRDNGRLDLDARDGKRPGGFANPMPWSRDAFILMNASGADIDIQILLHEMGHAIHAILGYAHQPLDLQNQVTEEIAEVASMSMELLASPFLHRDEGGFYDDAGYHRAVSELWSQIVMRFPYICVVDAWQHWLYTDPAGSDRKARDAKWIDLWDSFQPEIDCSGLERERTGRRLRQLHLIIHPFYYIEYAIAQLGALQVWRYAREDAECAISRYRDALSLAGSRPLPELFATAGARMIFDRAGMKDMATFARSELDRVQARQR
jgi:oligoendopeptidase F